MKAVVFSDSHGNYAVLEAVVEKNPDAELFIFLGDGIDEAETLGYIYNEKRLLAVSGNCDYGSAAPEFALTEFCGKKIFYCHGAYFGVKSSLSGAISAAKEGGAEILLFGHTHIPFTGKKDGLYIMNPGSCGRPRTGVPSYGTIEISDSGEIVLSIKEI